MVRKCDGQLARLVPFPTPTARMGSMLCLTSVQRDRLPNLELPKVKHEGASDHDRPVNPHDHYSRKQANQ